MAFDISERITVKEGWLVKQGGVIKSWKSRWFVLYDNNELCYFKSNYDREPIDIISLANMVQMPTNNATLIELSVEGRVYQMQAPTVDEAKDWVRHLSERASDRAKRTTAPQDGATPATKTTTIDVKGLMCKHCEDQVARLLTNAKGINKYEILSDEDRLILSGTMDIGMVLSTLESNGFIVALQ
ncbi:hypothetical protein SAMD00019534_067870 [Acytostelium subglobosum LB1]|uniref:hypothetical protein n=1 Tax=Acytostelium subglobosum LB1 TaxID=1410327 RepID=UPI000645029B|nr:hypothetical protein SAMD00019534_067870 [Acytostelium subglobosum LB1]GAM23612.1 hypothetical protein SAMD00019534_067870 [Acytostelium subglobosum LB1]|eukprot:XP_012753353.1 hypothetical protein SAMD00019534_067870 [Acytostelium subglobosum LB1]